MRRKHRTREVELRILQCGEGADGDLTTAAEFTQHGSLGGYGQTRPRIVERRTGVVARSFFQCLDGERALSHGGAHDVRPEDFADDVAPAPTAGADSAAASTIASYVAALDLIDAGVHVAADGLNVEVGPDEPELRDAAEGAGADHRAEFQIAQLAADDGVIRIGAARDSRDGEAGRQVGWQVLHAVHGEVDAAVEQRFFDFLGEETFAADSVERGVENFVAGGFDDLDPALGPARFQTFPDIVRLPERKLRAPGPRSPT